MISQIWKLKNTEDIALQSRIWEIGFPFFVVHTRKIISPVNNVRVSVVVLLDVTMKFLEHSRCHNAMKRLTADAKK
jgi:hypothetical protein